MKGTCNFRIVYKDDPIHDGCSHPVMQGDPCKGADHCFFFSDAEPKEQKQPYLNQNKRFDNAVKKCYKDTYAQYGGCQYSCFGCQKIGESLDDTILKSMKIEENGEVEIATTGGAGHRLIVALANFYEANGGENYFTMTFEGTVRGERKRYEITIRNLKGNKSPAETIQELKTKLAEYQQADGDWAFNKLVQWIKDDIHNIKVMSGDANAGLSHDTLLEEVEEIRLEREKQMADAAMNIQLYQNGCLTCSKNWRTCMVHDTAIPFVSCNHWEIHPNVATLRNNVLKQEIRKQSGDRK